MAYKSTMFMIPCLRIALYFFIRLIRPHTSPKPHHHLSAGKESTITIMDRRKARSNLETGHNTPATRTSKHITHHFFLNLRDGRCTWTYTGPVQNYRMSAVPLSSCQMSGVRAPNDRPGFCYVWALRCVDVSVKLVCLMFCILLVYGDVDGMTVAGGLGGCMMAFSTDFGTDTSNGSPSYF
jgi:hypothetical protein